MAGPFALPGNTAQDVAPTQLAGGVGTLPQVADSDPTLAVIESVAQGVQTVAQVNTNRLEKEAVSGVQQEIKSVRDALQISKHPNLEQSFFSSEAMQDPYIQSVHASKRYVVLRHRVDYPVSTH